MKLLDVTISRKYLDKQLKDDTFYIKFEQLDILYSLKQKNRFSYSDLISALDEKKTTFAYIVENVTSELKAALGEDHVNLDEDPEIWVNDYSKMNFVHRCLIVGVESIDVLKNVINDIKQKLLSNEIYLKVKEK